MLSTFYNPLADFLSSPDFNIIMWTTFFYLVLLWFAILYYVTRDIITRSHHLVLQVVSILLGCLSIPGLVLYILIRPKKTIEQLQNEEIEKKVLQELSDSDKIKKNKNK